MSRLIAVESVHSDAELHYRDFCNLVRSIREVGIIDPLIVCPGERGGYEVVAGHRRLAAARHLGVAKVQCRVSELDQAGRLAVVVATNVARTATDAIAEAETYSRMVGAGATDAQVAAVSGTSTRHVRTYLALLRLPTQAQRQLAAGKITVADGTALLDLREHPQVIRALLRDRADRRDIHRAVQREVWRLDAQSQRLALISRLRGEGVFVLEEWTRRDRRKGRPVPLGAGPNELDVDADEHRREPCHAAFVSRSAEVTVLCIDPTRHLPVKSFAASRVGRHDRYEGSPR
jgi:ParB/RepB/Spo0J family partition protein